MISLALQSERDLGGRLSVLSRQKREHVQLDHLLSELAATPVDRHDPVLRRIYRLVFPHALAEEAVLWPVLRRVLPDGPEITLQVEREHQEDVRDEEDVLLPRLQAAVSRSRLRGLGLVWELVRRVSPTRAHPVVARRPPGNALAAIPLSVIDRTRDRLDQVIQRGPRRAAPRLETASRVLATLAHQAERLPPFTRGEHPTTHR